MNSLNLTHYNDYPSQLMTEIVGAEYEVFDGSDVEATSTAILLGGMARFVGAGNMGLMILASSVIIPVGTAVSLGCLVGAGVTSPLMLRKKKNELPKTLGTISYRTAKFVGRYSLVTLTSPVHQIIAPEIFFKPLENDDRESRKLVSMKQIKKPKKPTTQHPLYG